MKYLILLLILFLTACATGKLAHRYADKHPDEFAEFCTTNYPIISEFPSGYSPANNEDYTPIIGEIVDKTDSAKFLLIGTKTDSVEFRRIDTAIATANRYFLKGMSNPSISQDYLARIKELSGLVQRLKQSYRPCKPDTIGIPYKVLDSAKMALLYAKIAQQDRQIQTANLKSEAEKQAEKRQKWYIYCAGFISIPLAYGLIKLIKLLL